jgi:serine protease Do
LAETLIEKGKITRAYLGLIPMDLKEFQKSQFKVSSGALVYQVPSDSPSAAAGIKPNDVIIRIGSVPVTDQVDLRNAMLKYAPGTAVDVELVRDGKHETVSVKLKEIPEELLRPTQQPNSRSFNMPNDGSTPDVKDFMKQFEDRLKSDSPSQKVGRAQLGVQVQDIDANGRKQFNIPNGATGAVVASVLPGSVAERLGLKPGDVIQKIGDLEVKSAEDVKKGMEAVQWGDVRQVGSVRFSPEGAVKQVRDVQFK